MVIGPTPPGTGVMADAFSLTFSKSTSPQSLPFSSRSMPTSMTTAPSFTISAVINFGLPMAATKISARLHSSKRSFVLLWQTVTVASALRRSSAMGRPTILLLPTTTARLPATGILLRESISMTPSGVQATVPASLRASLPMFSAKNPSTSLEGGMRDKSRFSSSPRGSGSWMRMP